MTKKPNNWMEYSGIGIQMALTMIICWWIGSKVDGWMDVEPWGSLVGIFFGMFVGMYNLIKIV